MESTGNMDVGMEDLPKIEAEESRKGAVKVAKAKKEPAELPKRKSAPEFDFSTKPASRRKVRSGSIISFFLMVIAPFLASIFYYVGIASDQYRSEALFSVRGTTTSPLAALGMLSLPGAAAQSGDSYVVTEYIRSQQIVADILNQAGLDVREKFASDGIDWLYRIDRGNPLTKFVEYWRWMSAVEFNSTTGVITFKVDAFSAEDAQQIAKAVLKVSDKLVNTLSENAKQQVIASAADEVKRTEERLNEARQAVEGLRNKEQIIDVTGTAQIEQSLLGELQKQELDLKARRSSIAKMAANSPIVKSLDSQIAVIQDQIEAQKNKVGTGTMSSNAKNISSLATEFQQLLAAQEFAEKAFIAAQSALETATQEARKQERYLAVVVEPTLADYSMYPKRFANIIMVLFGSFVIWLLAYLLAMSIRDHAR